MSTVLLYFLRKKNGKHFCRILKTFLLVKDLSAHSTPCFVLALYVCIVIKQKDFTNPHQHSHYQRRETKSSYGNLRQKWIQRTFMSCVFEHPKIYNWRTTGERNITCWSPSCQAGLWIWPATWFENGRLALNPEINSTFRRLIHSQREVFWHTLYEVYWLWLLCHEIHSS